MAKVKMPVSAPSSAAGMADLFSPGRISDAAAMDRVYTSAEEFSRGLQALGAAAQADVAIIVKKAVFMLLERLMTRTPVDTGRARAGWQVTVDGESDYAPPPGQHLADPSRFASLPTAVAVYNIENNVEYIIPLEAGHSQQAPSGFLAVSLAEFGQYFAQAAASLGYEVTT